MKKARNVINGEICSMAKLDKETDKAVCISYLCEIYGKFFTVKHQWFPKSQLDIKQIQDDTIWFIPKNDWILDKKTKEYYKWVAEIFPNNLKHEIKTYLSNINNEIIKQVSR